MEEKKLKTICFKLDEERTIEIKKRALDKGLTLKDLLTELIKKELEEDIN